MVLFSTLVVLLPLKPVYADSEISGNFSVNDVGALQNVTLEFYEEDEDGNKELLEDVISDTDYEGDFKVTLSPDIRQKMAEGKIFVKAVSKSPFNFYIEDPKGDYYKTDYVKFDAEGQSLSTNLDGTKKQAFMVYNNVYEVESFFDDIWWGDLGAGNTIDDDLQERMLEILHNELKIVFPAEGDSSGYNASWLSADRIDLREDSFDSDERGDGTGDAVAHEYAHYMTNMLVGDSYWKALSTQDISHQPGDSVNPPDAFKEDIAYFIESIFDGTKKDSLVDADYQGYYRKQTGKIEDNRQIYVEAMRKRDEALKKGDQAAANVAQGRMDRALDNANRERADYNKFVANFRSGPGTIDGIGGNVLCDMYDSDAFGDKGYIRLRKFLHLLIDDQPLGTEDFYNKWVAKYPDEEQALRGVYERYGFFTNPQVNELPEIDWSEETGEVKHSTVIVVDGSGSMKGEKIKYARSHARSIVRRAAPDEEVALFVFNDCNVINREAEFTLLKQTLYNKIDKISAEGGTPIALALSTARDYLNQERHSDDGKIVLITDGGESCSGDTKKAAEGVKQLTFNVDFEVVGYNLEDKDKEQLKELARAGGGKFYSKKVWEKGGDERKAIEAFKKSLAVGAVAGSTALWAMSLGQLGGAVNMMKLLGNKSGDIAAKALQKLGPISQKVAQKAGPLAQKIAQKAGPVSQKVGEVPEHIREFGRNISRIMQKMKSKVRPKGSSGA